MAGFSFPPEDVVLLSPAGTSLVSGDGKMFPLTIFADSKTNSFARRPTLMSFGNSIARLNQPGYSTAGQAVSYGYLWWAMGFAGWPFRFSKTGAKTQIGASSSSQFAYGVYGYSGATSVTLMGTRAGGTNYFALTVTPNRPDYCVLQMMENDVTEIVLASVTRVEVLAAYDLVIDSCLQMGTRPIWVECLPSQSYNSAPHAVEYDALNSYVAARAVADSRIIYVPTKDLYTDTSTAYPVPASSGNFANYADASVHPQIAAVWIGKRVSDVLAAQGITGWNMPLPGINDGGIFGNTLMMGASGTLTTFTGSGPNGITATTSVVTPTTKTAAKVMVDSRECLELNIASSTAQTGIVNLAQINPTTSPSTGFSVGDYVQAFADIELRSETTPVGFRGFQFNLANNGGGGTVGVSFLYSDSFDLPFPTNTRFRVATPAIPVTSGTTSIGPILYLKASNNAAAIAAKLRVHAFAIANGGA